MDDIEQNTRADNPNVQADRVKRAHHALRTYMVVSGVKRAPNDLGDIDEAYITDLVVDLMHLADAHPDSSIDGTVVHYRAGYHFDAETGSELIP